MRGSPAVVVPAGAPSVPDTPSDTVDFREQATGLGSVTGAPGARTVTGRESRSAPLLVGYRFAIVAVADNGQDPAEPVEIGVVRVEGGILIEPCRTWLVRPMRPIEPWATRGHGLTDADVDQARKLSEVAADVRAAVGERILVAHRARWCAQLLSEVGVGLACGPLDVRCLSTRVWPVRSRSLGELLRHAGLHPPGVLGRAGHDAMATALLFVELARDLEKLAQRCDVPVSTERLIDWATPPANGPAW